MIQDLARNRTRAFCEHKTVKNGCLGQIAAAIVTGNTVIAKSASNTPFGGEALSSTGFKAGGQYYLLKFCTERVVTQNLTVIGANTELLFLD